MGAAASGVARGAKLASLVVEAGVFTSAIMLRDLADAEDCGGANVAADSEEIGNAGSVGIGGFSVLAGNEDVGAASTVAIATARTIWRNRRFLFLGGGERENYRIYEIQVDDSRRKKKERGKYVLLTNFSMMNPEICAHKSSFISDRGSRGISPTYRDLGGAVKRKPVFVPYTCLLYSSLTSGAGLIL